MYLNNLSFTAVFVEDPQGGYSAYVEELPGANSREKHWRKLRRI